MKQSGPAVARHNRARVTLVALVAGAALLAGATAAGLWAARGWAVRELNSPEAARAWNEWRAEAARPTPGVERRVPKSGEPPLLVLLRDHFAGVLAGVLVPLLFLYAFLAFVGWRLAGDARASETRPRE